MPDLEAAAAHPAPLVVDSTVATPVHLRPLEHGADFALHSATKYLGGHDDVLLGAVVCRDPAVAEAMHTFRTRTGIVAAADPAWQLLRGLKTLELRVARQGETAAVIAERLAAHPKVQTVRYPGLSGLLSFDVADADAARRVETSTRVIVNATSLGGVTSVMESRYRWEGDRVPVRPAPAQRRARGRRRALGRSRGRARARIGPPGSVREGPDTLETGARADWAAGNRERTRGAIDGRGQPRSTCGPLERGPLEDRDLRLDRVRRRRRRDRQRDRQRQALGLRAGDGRGSPRAGDPRERRLLAAGRRERPRQEHDPDDRRPGIPLHRRSGSPRSSTRCRRCSRSGRR